MQKIKIVLTSFIAIIMCLGVFTPKGHAATTTDGIYSFSYKLGDILITKSTDPSVSGKGIVGHAGIVIQSEGKYQVLQIAGFKKYPDVYTFAEWYRKKPTTKVVRPNNSSLGKNASKKAKYYFENKKIKYSLDYNPTNISSIYCSELVWYSYYKAGKNFQIKKPISKGVVRWGTPNFIYPYDYLNSSYLNHNGFKIVKTIKW